MTPCESEDKLRRLSRFDPLTGLPSREQLIWRAERAIEQAGARQQRCALLLIGLDRFKAINDKLGHTAGDEVLIEVAHRLRSCVRHSDQPVDQTAAPGGVGATQALEGVARWGGDEFAVLLPEIAADDDAERAAQGILAALREPLWVGGRACFVSASVGLAIAPREGCSVDVLLRLADRAMHSVKARGGDAAATFGAQTDGQGPEQPDLEAALAQALERGEILLHYQPRVDVRTARMLSVEAQLRWQHAGALVEPRALSALAHRTGLIVPLTEWALGEAARQARLWQDAIGFADSIAVNMPGRIFERPHLVELIDQCVSQHGVPHSAIQLQITEHELVPGHQDALSLMHRLYGRGVEISLGSFGVGFSSLAYLGKLPLSEISLHHSFMQDIGLSPGSSEMVMATLALTRSLGIRLVVEGVENLRQQYELRRLGCDYMQGPLFCSAVPPEELQRWIEATVSPREAPSADAGDPRPTAAPPAVPPDVPPPEAAPSRQSFWRRIFK